MGLVIGLATWWTLYDDFVGNVTGDVLAAVAAVPSFTTICALAAVLLGLGLSLGFAYVADLIRTLLVRRNSSAPR